MILAGFYAIYVRDLNIFAGLFVQQAKYNRSIMLVFYYLLGTDAMKILKVVLLVILRNIYKYSK